MVAIEYAIMNDIYDEYIAMEGFGKKKGKNIFQRILELFRKILDKLYHLITGKKTKHQKAEERKETLKIAGAATVIIAGGCYLVTDHIKKAFKFSDAIYALLVYGHGKGKDPSVIIDAKERIQHKREQINLANKEYDELKEKIQKNDSIDKDELRKKLNDTFIPLKNQIEHSYKNAQEASDKYKKLVNDKIMDDKYLKVYDEWVSTEMELLVVTNKMISLISEVTQ